MNKQPLTNSYWPLDNSQPLIEGTLGDLLREVALECPNQVALVDGVSDPSKRRRWTYQELLKSAEAIARTLLTSFNSGDRIAIYMPNCAEWVLLQHGIHLAGLVLVPINPAYNKQELTAILRNSGAAGLFYINEYRGRNIHNELQTISSELPHLHSLFNLNDWHQFIAQGNSDTALPLGNSDDLLQIQFTSGTTGEPKGACLHHKGVINTSRLVALRAGFPKGGVWINAMPMFHVGGSVVTALGTLNLRGTYVVAPGFEPESLLELIESEKGNITLVVPTMILALLDSPSFDQRDLSSLKTILSGAAEVPGPLVNRTKAAFDCDLSILFGQTELNGVVCQTSINDNAVDQSETLGQPLPQAEVCIVDQDSGEITAIGEPGEILVRGYQNMQGYYGLDEASKETINKDGWLHTGDVATMDARGYLSITGRIKDMLIRGGMNIYPKEIEATLFSHPGIAQVSVIGIRDEKWGEIIAAVMIRDNSAPACTAEELFSYCRQHLATHKTPEQWFFVDNYPLTPSGKVQKFVLQDWVTSGKLVQQAWQRPASNR